MTRIRAAALLLVVLFAPACGDDGGDSDGAGEDATAPAPETPPSTVGALPATEVGAVVYFGRDGAVATAGRSVGTPAVARAALESMLEGPTAFEAELGLRSAIPDRTQLRDISVADGTATVDLSGAFLEDPAEDTALRVAQVVFTLTQFPTIERVTILIEGFGSPSVGLEAVPVLDVDRGDFEAVTPFILVESPTPGEAVGGPVEVSGIANTFEATVAYEVTDADGAIVDSGFTTASAGSGTWGAFSFTTEVAAGDVLVTVFQESAEDGSRADVYAVPVAVS